MKIYDIKTVDGLLPDISETKICIDYEKDPSDLMRCIYYLYIALSERENYCSIHKSSVQEDPIYANCVGRVEGILQATGWEEYQSGNHIIVKQANGRWIFIIPKLSK